MGSSGRKVIRSLGALSLDRITAAGLWGEVLQTSHRETLVRLHSLTSSLTQLPLLLVQHAQDYPSCYDVTKGALTRG